MMKFLEISEEHTTNSRIALRIIAGSMTGADKIFNELIQNKQDLRGFRPKLNGSFLIIDDPLDRKDVLPAFDSFMGTVMECVEHNINFKLEHESLLKKERADMLDRVRKNQP